MTHAVSLTALRKVYPGATEPAVDNVSLQVPVGTIYGLLGPNGAGKTTTIGICTTRVRASGGEAVVAGHSVHAAPTAVRRVIGVAAQALTLDRACTVRENIYFHCRYFGIGRHAAKERTDELLERFRIADRASAMPASLSGGLAQRVQLARAIAHRPEVLFLDEPTAGLDPQSRLALWDLVRSLKADGISVVLTTHYMEEADQLCDRLAIVDHGRLLAEGTPAELKRQTGGAAAIDLALSGARNDARQAAQALAGVQEIQDTERGLRILVRPEGAGVPRVVAAVAPFGLTDLRVVDPSLETVFISLTGRDLRE